MDQLEAKMRDSIGGACTKHGFFRGNYCPKCDDAERKDLLRLAEELT